jgi:hypothetical protein
MLREEILWDKYGNFYPTPKNEKDNSSDWETIEKMSTRMTESQNKIFMREFKRFFLELLYFYWNLSDGNPIIRKLENSFKMSLAQYSAYIAKTPMTIETMQKIVDILRNELKIMIKSNAFMNNGEFTVEFEIFLIGD